MDYPCLPSLSEEENLARVEKTIENTKKCLKIEGIKWVTIIQGYSLDQYKYCIELIEEELETELIGGGITSHTHKNRRYIQHPKPCKKTL